MKLAIVICCIFIIIQLSSALPGLRFKRNDFASNDPKIYFRATKEMAAKFDPLVRAVLSELPSTPDFKRHKEMLISYLQKSDENRNEKGLCFVKTFKKLEDFIGMLTLLKEDNVGSEAQIVMELFNRNGFKELETNFHRFIEGYDVYKFMRHVEMLSEDDDFELLEEC